MKTFVYGQTQHIEFGCILVTRGSYHRESNQASLAMPSVAKCRKNTWRVVTENCVTDGKYVVKCNLDMYNTI